MHGDFWEMCSLERDAHGDGWVGARCAGRLLRLLFAGSFVVRLEREAQGDWCLLGDGWEVAGRFILWDMQFI